MALHYFLQHHLEQDTFLRTPDNRKSYWMTSLLKKTTKLQENPALPQVTSFSSKPAKKKKVGVAKSRKISDYCEIEQCKKTKKCKVEE